MTRWEWKLPSDTALSKRHPLTAEPFWSFVLRRAGVPVSDSATLSGSKGVVEHNWQLFLELLGWWEVKRCFNRSGDSVALKPVADIVVIHPVGRFTQASTDAQWRDAVAVHLRCRGSAKGDECGAESQLTVHEWAHEL